MNRDILIAKVIKDKDILVNFAAETHVDRSIQDPSVFIRTDVLGTYNLLEQAREADVGKFLHISTDEVYGPVLKGGSRETDVLMPSNPYSASKAGADRLAFSYYITYGMHVIIARPSNNFGPYQYPEKIIPLFITNVLQEKKVPLYGDGLYERDWLHVRDNCEALKVLLERGSAGEVYNIGADNGIPNMKLTEHILDIMGKDENWIEHVEDRPGHDRRYCVDSTKIGILGWKPKANFKNELTQTIEWYQNNEKWWKPLLKDVVGGKQR